MTQEATETGTISLEIVSCKDCDQLFLLSPRRQTCPTCGGDAGMTFFQFEASGPGGVVMVGRLPEAETISAGDGAAVAGGGGPAVLEDQPPQPPAVDVKAETARNVAILSVVELLMGKVSTTDAAAELEKQGIGLAVANRIAGLAVALGELLPGNGDGGEPANGDEDEEEEEAAETEAPAEVDTPTADPVE